MGLTYVAQTASEWVGRSALQSSSCAASGGRQRRPANVSTMIKSKRQLTHEVKENGVHGVQSSAHAVLLEERDEEHLEHGKTSGDGRRKRENVRTGSRLNSNFLSWNLIAHPANKR